jgi:hypothetical protein
MISSDHSEVVLAISAMGADEKMSEQTLVRYTPSLAELIDEWRRAQLDTPNRADAIRRLISIALRVEGTDKLAKPKGEAAAPLAPEGSSQDRTR